VSTQPRQRRREAKPQNSDALSIEIHGSSISPSNFDVLSGLAYVHSYLELLAGVAQAKQETVNFKGLRLEPGSVAFKIDVDEPVLAREITKEATEMVMGQRLPPRGLRARVRSVQQALSRIPAGNAAHVSVDSYSTQLSPIPDEASGPRVEFVELRVTVYRIGGTPARVSVASEVDGGFTLSIDQAEAEAIAKHLYHEVDLVARIERTDDGKIAEGKALKFFPVESVAEHKEADVWRNWFATAASEWDEVEDIEVELDRYRGNPLRE
jgi:hypothetical protein